MSPSASNQEASVQASDSPVRWNPEVVFFLLTLLFSWPLWIAVILSSRGVIPLSIHSNPFGSFGPALGAIVVSGLIGGRSSVRALFATLGRLSASKRFLLGICILPIAMFATSAISWGLLRQTIPRLEGLELWYLLIPLVPAILILGGPLGEEIGWRGFLLPRLQQRFSPITSSLVVAAAWLVWHLPLFWMEGAKQKGSSIAGFAVMIVAMSVLSTWIYNRSAGSLWPIILFHTAVNTAGFVFPAVLPTVDASRLHSVLLVVVVVVVAAFVAIRTQGRLGYDDSSRARLP